MEVVGRFLALLELYREGVLAFDQAAALAELRIRWVAPDEASPEPAAVRSETRTDHDPTIDEEYG